MSSRRPRSNALIEKAPVCRKLRSSRECIRLARYTLTSSSSVVSSPESMRDWRSEFSMKKSDWSFCFEPTIRQE